MAQNERMKKFILLAGFVLAAGALARADESFSKRVTPEEFGAAGLAKLTPEELTRLDALFGKYGRPGADANELAAAQARAAVAEAKAQQAEQAQQAAQATARAAEAEARARKAEQEAAAARAAAGVARAEQKKSEESFLTKAKKVFVSPGTKVSRRARDGDRRRVQRLGRGHGVAHDGRHDLARG